VGQVRERRKWPRLEVAFKIRLRPVEGNEGSIGEKQFFTRNISTGGLLFESEKPVPLSEGTVFDVEISMPLAKYGFASARRLEARGKVCRIEEPGDGGRAGVAMEFMAPPRFVAA